MNKYKITSLTPGVGNDDDDSDHEVVLPTGTMMETYPTTLLLMIAKTWWRC